MGRRGGIFVFGDRLNQGQSVEPPTYRLHRLRLPQSSAPCSPMLVFEKLSICKGLVSLTSRRELNRMRYAKKNSLNEIVKGWRRVAAATRALCIWHEALSS
jgi:hypothetical protein